MALPTGAQASPSRRPREGYTQGSAMFHFAVEDMTGEDVIGDILTTCSASSGWMS